MRRTRTRTKSETRNPRYKPAFSFSENEMMGLGLFASSSSSSSSSSSNLSPLALPFTVERSNNTKFNFSSNPDPHFNFNFNDKSDGTAFWSTSPNFQSSTATQGLLADSIRTATVPSTYSMFPNPISTPNTHNRSSVPAVNLSAIGPNQRATDTSFSSPFNAPNTHNWSSMNSSVKSGLEPINPPVGHSYGMNPNSQPHKWSLSNDDSDNGASVMSLNFNLLPYGSSQASYTQCLSGSKYIGQGKEDSHSHMFGHPVTRENNIGSSVIGKIHITSPSSTSHHELVSSNGFSNEDTFTWNKCTPRYPFDNTSIFYNSSSDHTAPPITTKSLDVNNTSLFTNYNLSVPHDPLKEKESYHAVGYDYKSSLNSQVLDMNNTEEVTSAAQLSEHLDHHNPGEDSPCWKGATSHFSSSGSQEHESSSHHPLNKPLKNSDEDALLHQSLHGTVETAANFVTSESLDVNTVVKGLNNLSELLLQLYLKDECGLKEQDHKALDHVISNLNVCLSSKIQVDHTQKFPSHKHNHITSNVIHEEKNSDQFGKNIEEPKSDFVNDEGLPKDFNMVQKIKRVLDEDLECTEDLPSDPVLFKNLWLEAEAELCVSGYKARLHRAKRDMCKSKALVPDVVSDIKKVSSTSYSPTAHELLHETFVRKTSNTHTPNLSLPVVNDVENSVMARFNILKLREESNSVQKPADVEVSCSKVQSFGVVNETHFHLQHLLDTGDGVLMQDPVVNEDVDHAVMARLNVLKSRGELDRVNPEQGVLRDVGHAQVSEEGVGMQNQFGSLAASSFGWEYVTKG